MGLECHAAVTHLWQCLSTKMGICLCNMGFREDIDLERLMEEIRMSVIGDRNKLSQW